MTPFKPAFFAPDDLRGSGGDVDDDGADADDVDDVFPVDFAVAVVPPLPAGAGCEVAPLLVLPAPGGRAGRALRAATALEIAGRDMF